MLDVEWGEELGAERQGEAAPRGQQAKGKRKPFPSDEIPAISGHLFLISLSALPAVASHLSSMDTLPVFQSKIQNHHS
jgi:hypothetical protein